MSTADQGLNAEFATVRRGYDPDEVDQYINALQASARADLKACEERIAETETALEAATQREEAVHLMLVAASQTREEMVAAARQEVEEATKHASEDAETLLADAKREAFAIVTDARTEADGALTDAKRDAEAIVAKALEDAQAIAAEPHLHATFPEADAGPSLEERAAAEQHVAQLSAQASELEQRITGLKAVALELETRLADFARGALDDLGQEETLQAASVADVSETKDDAETPSRSAPVAFPSEPEPALPADRDPAIEPQVTENRPLTEEELPPVVRKNWKRPADEAHNGDGRQPPAAPSVEEAAPPMEAAIVDEPLEHSPTEERVGDEGDADDEAAASLTNRGAATGRGSFYSRRSAKLPRIGVEAGRGALAAVSAMRSHAAHPDDEETDETKGAGDFAAQSA